ncbi:MAG: DUF6382 domain-containing protein [Eubacteriales bacterium]
MDSLVINGESGELIELSSEESNYFNKDGNFISIDNIINYENIGSEYFEISFYQDIFILRNHNIQDVCINNKKIGYNQISSLEDMDKINSIDFSLTFKSGSNEIRQSGFSRLGIYDDKILAKNDEFQNNMNQLVIEYEIKEFASYVLDMLKNNQIESLLPYEILTMDSKVRIYYNIEGMIGLVEYIKSIDFKNSQSTIILFNMIIKIEMLEEYLLNHCYLDLNIKKIFICKESLNVKFVLASNLDNTKNVYISLIKIIEGFNEAKPNNYLNFEKSNFRGYLLEENAGLNMLGRLLLEEERQNRIDDEISYHGIAMELINTNDNLRGIASIENNVQEEGKTISRRIIGAFIKNNHNFKLGFAFQIILLIAISAIYLTNYLKTFDFIALLIILGALDLWVLKYTKIL